MNILITGVSSGIGEKCAFTLANQGHRVIALGRHRGQWSGEFYNLDISKNSSIKKCVKKIKKQYSHIDVLINNAGYGLYGAIEDVSIKDAKKQFDTNVFGLVSLTKAILPLLRQSQKAKIINISSVAGKINTPLGAWYHASKFALESLSDAMRFELKHQNIDVVIVEPGSIKSNWENKALNNQYMPSASKHYANLSKATIKLFSKIDAYGSSPQVISNLIQKIIKLKNPKSRYHAGRFSTMMLLSARCIPDKMYDCILRFILRFFA